LNAAKINAANSYGQKKASRKRRSQAPNIELSQEIQMMLDAPESSEFEGWVFRSCIDCKIGVLLNVPSHCISKTQFFIQHLIQYQRPHLQGLAFCP